LGHRGHRVGGTWYNRQTCAGTPRGMVKFGKKYPGSIVHRGWAKCAEPRCWKAVFALDASSPRVLACPRTNAHLPLESKAVESAQKTKQKHSPAHIHVNVNVYVTIAKVCCHCNHNGVYRSHNGVYRSRLQVNADVPELRRRSGSFVWRKRGLSINSTPCPNHSQLEVSFQFWKTCPWWCYQVSAKYQGTVSAEYQSTKTPCVQSINTP
jgi:hypothetical protein